MNSKKNLLAATVAFFVGSGAAVVSAADQNQVEELNQRGIDEIIVTASKRGSGQSIQDTPMSISALSGDDIEQKGLVKLSDYANTLPGVTLADLNPGDKRVYIRGLANLADQQLMTSTYLGEMPLSIAGQGSVDLRLVDIERIEVLKGPQGTLYGSGSLAGTLRYIPVAPNLDNVEGSIDVDFATVAESDDTSQSFSGVFNAPLIDGVLGLRVAAYHVADAGFIDLVSTAPIETVAAATGNQVNVDEDVNSVTTSGIRASLLWQISDALGVNLTLGTQDQEVDGVWETSKALGGYENRGLDVGNIGGTSDADYAGLVVSYDLGWGELTSASSLMNADRRDEQQAYPLAGGGVFLGPANQVISNETDMFSQELRFSSQLEGPIQFVAGLYYEDVERKFNYDLPWHGVPFTDTLGVHGFGPGFEFGFPNAFPGGVPGLAQRFSSLLDYQQFAVFGELSYQMSDVLELTVGVRHFDYDREDIKIVPGQSAFDGPASITPLDSSENGQTYKANLSYTPNDDTLFYAQWSEGFRLGFGQFVPPAATCDVDNDGFLDHTGARLDPQLDSDTTENFELGAKFTLLDNRLTLNAAIYQMDWANIPQHFSDTTEECLSGISNNVGEAQSEGVELEISYLMTSALKVDLALAYNESEYTKVIAGNRIELGEDLAFAPHSTANLGLEYSFDASSYPAFIRSDIHYFGESEANVSGFNYPTVGDYVNLGLRAGVNIDQWELAIYGSNLLNKDTSTSFVSTDLATRLTPRKLGLSAKYSF